MNMKILSMRDLCLNAMFYSLILWTVVSTAVGQGAYCPVYVTWGKVDANCTRVVNATCNFTCDKGYIPAKEGLYRVSCDSNGNWLPNPACVDIGFVALVNPEPANNYVHLYSIATSEDGLLELSVKPYSVFNTHMVLMSVSTDAWLRHVYIYDHYTKVIYRGSNFNIGLTGNINWSPFHGGVSRDFLKLAVDWVNHNIYWTDPMFRWIMMKRMNTSSNSLYKFIVYENVEAPYGIAVDPNSQYLFWSNIGDSGAQIRRSNLLGQNTTSIVDTKLLKPFGMAVDLLTKYLFWVDAGRGTIESCNYDGLYRQSLRRFRNSMLYDIALLKNVMYVTDTKSGMLYYLDKRTANNIHYSFNRTSETFFGVGVFNPEAQPIELESLCSSKPCAHMCTYVNSLPTCVCKEGFVVNTTDKTKCEEDLGVYHRELVLSDNRQICVFDIRIVTHVNYSLNCIIQMKGILAFTMDMWDRKLYLANADGLFYGAMFSFGNGNLITQTAGNVTGLELDWIDQYLYWAENRHESNGSDVIKRMSLSVTPYKANIFLAGLSKPRDIVVVPFNRTIFWISGTIDKKIEMANLDNLSDRPLTVINHTLLRNPKSLTFDPDKERLYWVDFGTIYSAKIDGTDVHPLHGATEDVINLVFVYKAYVLLSRRQINHSIIESRNISSNASRNSVPVKQMDVIEGMKAFDRSLQPKERGPCDLFNGGCDHLCIASNVSRICKCMFGYTLATNGRNCNTSPREDNFALVTDITDNTIYQVELTSQDVQAIDATDTEGPTGLAYDFINKQVIWGTEEGSVNSIFLNGSFERTKFSTDLHEPKVQRMAIDVSTLNIYFTGNSSTSNSSYIGIISPSGRYAKIITGLRNPYGIALYSSKGLIFWTEIGILPRIGRANMNGENIQSIIKSEINQPTGITIDYSENHIYWADSVLDRVERTDLHGNGRYIVSEERGAKLMDITVSGNYLYFTALERQYITKMSKSNKDDREWFARNAEFGYLGTITIYNSSESPPTNSLCSKNNGDCKQFCVPMPNNTRVCKCQEGDDLNGWRNCYGLITCPQDIPNGRFMLYCDYKVGTQCLYECNDGYKPSTQLQNITCGNLGNWDILQPCELILCPDNISLGFLSHTCDRRVGTTCNYSCNPGLKPISDNVLCLASGEWNKNVTTLCQVIMCPDNISLGFLSHACDRRVGTTCNYSCNPGLKPIAENVLCLQSGEWDKNVTTLCQVVMCPDNISLGFLSHTCDRRVGTTCNYSCNPGLKPIAENVLCLQSGEWDKNVTTLCQVIMCPNNISLGFLSHTCDRRVGTTCNYSCNPGLKPIAENVLCLQSGEWDKNVTTLCQVIMCPDNISLGFLSHTCDRRVGTTCNYSCNPGLKPIAENVLCLQSGEWDENVTTLCQVPATTSQGSKEEGRIGMIIGAVLGPLVLAIIIFVVLYIKWRRNRNNGQMFEEYQDQREMSTVSWSSGT